MTTSTNLQTTNSWSGATGSDAYKTELSYYGNGNIQSLKRNGSSSSLPMDNIDYNYIPGTNKLYKAYDNISTASIYTNDFKQKTVDTMYYYDKLGNLIEDKHDDIQISWTAQGKAAEE